MEKKEVISYITGWDLYQNFRSQEQELFRPLETDDAGFSEVVAVLEKNVALRLKTLATFPPIMLSRWSGIDAAVQGVKAIRDRNNNH